MAKVWDCVQGSTRWAELRAGRPCSSEFDRIVTPTGKSSKQLSDYCNYLIVETIIGRPLGSAEMPWMTRGKELEAEAVLYYELMNGVETIPVGFVTTDDERIGASPDRFVGDDGCVEIKAPLVETQTKYISSHINFLLGIEDGTGVADDYRVQLQGQLFVCERDHTDIVGYFPGLPDAIKRVGRDEKFIATMRSLLYQFLELFDERMEKLMHLGYVKEPKLKRGEKAEEVTAFGLTESDFEEYIAALEKKGTWGTPAGDAAVSGGEAASNSRDTTDTSGGGEPPQQTLFGPEPANAYAGDPGDQHGRSRRRR